jgi:16S rRNA (uracil1498-N3)-methyltransferase
MADERYFYISPASISGHHFNLDSFEAHHASHVLRLPVGSEIFLLDGEGTAYRAQITTVSKRSVEGDILETLPEYGESELNAHLAFGIIKADRLALLLEKGTELGVKSFQPLMMDRSIKRDVNLDRGNRIIIAAAKQCGRSYFPRLLPPITLDAWLKNTHTKQRIFCHRSADLTPAQLTAQIGEATEIHFLIGPEGDFSPRELDLLNRAHLKSLKLGGRRLRSETAGLAVLAILNALLQSKGDFSHD